MLIIFSTFVPKNIYTNVFVKPNEQIEACFNSAMARKRSNN